MNTGVKYDLNFWKHYDYKKVTMEPSLFANFCLSYIKQGQSLLDICSGNGRDSSYFKSKGINVISFDHDTLNLFDKTPKFNLTQTFNNAYCRFVLHCVPEHIEDYILINAHNVLEVEGLLFIETRSNKGTIVEKRTDHYCRGIDKDALIEKLKRLNFEIVFETEDNGFSPYKDEDPLLIRVIVKKKGEMQTRGTIRDEKHTYGPIHLMQSIYLLFTVKQVFEDNNIPFFLIFGTLLGAYRDQEFIPYDTDIDLGLFEKDNEKVTKLIDDGYFDIHGMLFIREHHHKHHLKALQYKRDYIDFWFFEKDKHLYRSGKLYTIEADQIDDGLSTIKFYGQKFKTVNNIVKYLERHYPNSDWRIPITNYHSKV
jgi:hypothetical protein